MKQFPLCKRLGVLRESKNFRPVISSTALYEALGPRLYKKSLRAFEYEEQQSHPNARPVELFLRKNWNIIKKGQRCPKPRN